MQIKLGYPQLSWGTSANQINDCYLIVCRGSGNYSGENKYLSEKRSSDQSGNTRKSSCVTARGIPPMPLPPGLLLGLPPG